MNSTSKNNEFVDIKKIYKKYIRYWYILVICLFVSIVLAIVYLKTAPPVFQMNANILINEDSGNSAASMQAAAMKNFALGGMLNFGGNSVNDEILLLSSYSLFRQVGEKLNLNVVYKVKKFPFDVICYKNSPIKVVGVNDVANSLQGVFEFNLKVDAQGKVFVKAYRGKEKVAILKNQSLPFNLQTPYGEFAFSATEYMKIGKSFKMDVFFSNYDLTAELLQQQVLVDLVTKKANVVNLGIQDNSIKKGKDILNAVIELYNNKGDDDKNQQADIADHFLEERIDSMSSELDIVERAIEQYKKENNLTDIETEAKIILEKGNDFKEKMIEAESQYTVIELVEQFLSKEENRYSLVPLNIGLSDKTVLEGLQKYNEALLERLRLLKTTQGGNPVIEASNIQLGAMRDNILATIKSIKSGFVQSRKDLQEQENYFLERIKGMPTQEREFISIKRQQMIKQELFLFLLQKKEENALNKAMVKSKAKIVDSAYCLSRPLSPKNSVVIVIALFLACLCFVSIVQLMDLRDKRKYKKDEFVVDKKAL